MLVFDRNEVNEEQEIAIKEEGNVLLIACPGSGKTRALIYKIAYELSRLRSSKKYIIAITYTHRAAEEIKERIELLGVDTSQLWIGTIHSFCLEWIIRPYQNLINDIKFGFRIINAQESEDILNTLCAPYTKPKITHFDCSYIFSTEGYILLCQQTNKHDSIRQILTEYWQILNENQQLDFELILYYSYQLLDKNPFIATNLSNIFSHILVDEYQDTREIQYKIIGAILTTGRCRVKSFIVGDPNQAIYTSLGGYPISKSDLEELCGQEFKVLQLTKNYRSSIIIINYFNHYRTFDNIVEGHGKSKDYPSIISYNRNVERENLEDEIVRLIRYNVEEKNVVPNEICIVAPQWVHLASLTRSLMVKMPDFSFNGPGMAPFARDIDNVFFKLCRIALTEPSPSMYISRLRWSSEFLSDLNHIGIDVSHFNRKYILKLCNSFTSTETDGIAYLRLFFEKLFGLLQIDFKQYASLYEHFESFFKSSESRIARLVKDGCDYISTTENFKKVFKQKDGITISTNHGVKGAEFNTVIAFGLLQDYIPHFAERNGEEAAKKLLYVISSRAKMNLHLISEKGRFRSWGNPPQEYTPTNQLISYQYQYMDC